jgi:hypothetical protein
MRYFVVFGRVGCGKSVFAREFAKSLGLEVSETSAVIIEHLARTKSRLHPCGSYSHELENLQKNKALYRDQLIWQANYMRSFNPAAVMLEAMSHGAVIVGPRRISEVNAWESQIGVPALLIKISRPDGKRVDDGYELDDIAAIRGNVIEIVNDGTLEELRAKAALLACSVREIGEMTE